MLSRRAVVHGLVSSTIAMAAGQTSSDTDEATYQLTYPSFEALTRPENFGYEPASEGQKQKATSIINETPYGPKPIDLAQSFVDRFYLKDPKLISQWPAPESWNPLIVAFFSATSSAVNNDMTPWCAAFVNWCLVRSNRTGSRNASSQSFLSNYFTKIKEPRAGDLAVFTCYDMSTKASLGIGHVCFFKERIAEDKIRVVGGNQSRDGHYSIISETDYLVTDRKSMRHVNGKYVACTMRLSAFIKID